jgi:hypothetical protein
MILPGKQIVAVNCNEFLDELSKIQLEKFDTVRRSYMLIGKAKTYNLDHIGHYNKQLLLKAKSIEHFVMCHPELTDFVVKERGISIADPFFSPNMKNLMLIDSIGIRLNIMVQGEISMTSGNNTLILKPNNCYMVDTQSGVSVKVLSPSTQLNLQLIPKTCKLRSWELLTRIS